MNVDIVQLVRDCMEQIGCGSAVDADIDPHSPICISLKSLPDLFVEMQDEQVILWSKLSYGGEAHVSRMAPDLAAHFLPRDTAVFVCRRPVLTTLDDALLLHAAVRPEYLGESEKFVQALEAFFEDLCATHEMLAQ